MTRKEIQKQENMLVEEAWKKARQSYISYNELIGEKYRLNNCKAWICSYDGYMFLISYDTLVVFIDCSGNLYDVLRLVYGYTSTITKHISKFRNTFRHVSEHTWREV